MVKLTTIDLDLTKNQISNLLKGKTVSLKHTQIGKLGMTMSLKDRNVKKLQTAHKNGKGKRLKLDSDEISSNMEGQGFMSSLKKAGKAISKVAHKTVDLYHDHVKDTAIGKKIKSAVKSTIKQTIEKAPEMLSKAVDFVPGVGHMISPYVEKYGSQLLADKYADELSDKAVDKIGLGLKYGKRAPHYMGRGVEFYRLTPLMGPDHSAMNPSLPFMDFSMPRQGYGFLPAGYR